jgi:NAD(P)-dependent dehydrogenase (short-subunit alcohol dehydrogenase family)
MNKQMNLEGKVAFVTGGAGGLGQVFCRRLAAAGARVVVADINKDRAEEIAEEIGGLGLVLDLRDSESVDECFRRTMERYKRLDVLINNGAIHLQKPVVEITDEEFSSVLDINLKGSFYAARAAARRMIALNNGGRIINIVTRLFANALSGPYMASKFGLWGLTGTLAMELAKYQITVNAVAPGVIRGTGMEKWFQEKARLSGLNQHEFNAMVEGSIPLGRTGTADEIADMALFLCGDGASYITGELFNVTGGWSGYSRRLG